MNFRFRTEVVHGKMAEVWVVTGALKTQWTISPTWEMSMRKIMLGIVAALTFSPALALAQAVGVPTVGVDLSSAQVQEAMKKALAELKPGVGVSDHLVSLPDMGKYNVGIAIIARPAGTNLSQYLVHDKITEIYYVLKGTGTQVTGTMVDGRRGQNVSGTIGPSMSSSSPLQNSHATKLGPGDTQIIAPGVGHGFTSIEPGGIEYITFRIDPEKVLKLP
jgi:mannose-6-phosphate isomerase-like protein (cupin superfamily)